MSLAIEPGLADRSVDIDLIRENSERAGWSIRDWQLEAGALEVQSKFWHCEQILQNDESINRCLYLGANYRNHMTVSLTSISIKQLRILRKTDMYLRTNYQERLIMPDISRASGVSGRTLERLFKKVFGLTPTAYVRVLRLHKAHRELATKTNHDKSIAHIAMDQGFTHLGRFSVSYREHFGQSPSEFRQALVHEVL